VQVLSLLTAQDISVLQTNAFDSENISLPLQLTATAMQARLMASAPVHVLESLTQEPITENVRNPNIDIWLCNKFIT
jgi:hypothetical protein